MDDDFNSGGAVSDLFQMLSTLNKFADEKHLDISTERVDDDLADFSRAVETLRELSAILGLFLKPPAKAVAGDNDELLDQAMQLLIEMRAEARKNKDFATADRVRDGLTAIGVTLEDRSEGTNWKAD